MDVTRNQHADDLEYVIRHLDDLWDVGDDCVLPTDVADWILEEFKLDKYHPVPNLVYDMMRDGTKSRPGLKQLRPDSALLAKISGAKRAEFKTIKHYPLMVSLAKANHELPGVKRGKLLVWLGKVCDEFPDWATVSVPAHLFTEAELRVIDKDHLPKTGKYPSKNLVIAYKLDGVAVGLYYEKGKLVRAGLRPHDGDQGEDVTEHVRYVRNIPQELPLPITCSIRGEIVCLKQDFFEVQAELARQNKQLRANERNHAAGALHQKDASKVAEARLYFIGYRIESLANPPYATEMDMAKWANAKLKIRFVRVTPFDWSMLKELERKARAGELEYLVDGAVISVNDFEAQEQMGRSGDRNTGTPNGRIAWKFADEQADPVLTTVEWATGRTGRVVPTGWFKPVSLAGTQVQRAVLHNLGFMNRLGIDKGAQVLVLKSGAIIPKVVGVIKRVKQVNYPKKCPSCGGNTVIRRGTGDNLELCCPNSDTCPAQSMNLFCHCLDTLGCMGIGPSTLTLFVTEGKVAEYADLFSIDVEDVTSCGLSRRQALNVLAGIHLVPNPEAIDDDDKLQKIVERAMTKPKRVSFGRFVTSLGIPSVGTSTGPALAAHFGNLNNLLAASAAELAEVDGIGTKTAEAIQDFLARRRGEIERYAQLVVPESPKTGSLTGKKFCFTGGFPQGKEHWQRAVETLGGTVKGSVSTKVDFLVVGSDPGDKVNKADVLGVRKIDLATLQGMLK